MNSKWTIVAGLVLPWVLGPAAPAPQAGAEIVLAGETEGVPVMKLIDLAREVTNEPFFFEPKDVREEKVWFAGTVRVPRERYLAFFDLCLRNSDLLHLEQTVAGTRNHLIRRLGQQARGQTALKTMARNVTLEELATMADRHTLITTMWTAKNLPARELVTTMQLYFADSATESIRNVEGTNAIVMTGYAANVAGIVAMADRLDAAYGNSTPFLRERDLETRLKKLEEQVATLQAGRAGSR